MKKILIALALAATYALWAFPQIPTHGVNADEFIYIRRTVFAAKFWNGHYTDPAWATWDAYDQPMLTNYIYALALLPQANQAGGYENLIHQASLDQPRRFCATDPHTPGYDWWCIDSKPPADFPPALNNLKSLVLTTRSLAVGLTAATIGLTFLIGALLINPFAGLIAGLYLGFGGLTGSLGMMSMIDPILLFLLTLQLYLALLWRRHPAARLELTLGLGLISGLSLATKLNAVGGLLCIAPLILLNDFPKKWAANLAQLTLIGSLALGVFIGLNPYVWNNPVTGITTMFNSRLETATNQQISNPALSLPTIQSRLTAVWTDVLFAHDQIWFKTHLPLVALLAGFGCLFLLTRPTLLWIIACNLAFLALYLPLRWDRYFLPLDVPLALLLGFTVTALGAAMARLSRSIRQNPALWGKLLLFTIVIGLTAYAALHVVTPTELALGITTLILTLHGAISSYGMLYSFMEEGRLKRLHPHTHILPGKANHSFSLIIPARAEAAVIGTTLAAMSRVNYPRSRYEVLVVVPAGDTATINAVNTALKTLNRKNMRLLVIDGDTHTKAYSLNLGNHFATGDIVGIFDAEDEIHPELLHRISATFTEEPKTAVVQAAVQLINLHSTWFSAINCLEYYFWFKSVLPFLSSLHATPLGGNTVFIRKQALKTVGFWDETLLTEDADIGIRLSRAGLSIKTTYLEDLATLEETPRDEWSVLRQRTRWDQGFLQVFAKGDWLRLKTIRQRLLTGYVLIQPFFRHLGYVAMLFIPASISLLHVRLPLALLSWLPLYFLMLQLCLYLIGLSDLSKAYRRPINLFTYLKVVASFFPYQMLLSFASLRALVRLSSQRGNWEKTSHHNLHRQG